MKGFQVSRDWSWWLAQKGGRVGLFLASTSMVVLMPLIFEINREVMVSRMVFFFGVRRRSFFPPRNNGEDVQYCTDY